MTKQVNLVKLSAIALCLLLAPFHQLFAQKSPQPYGTVDKADRPKNIRMIMPDTSISFTRQARANENTLTATINISFAKPFYAPENYPEFYEFYKKLFTFLKEQFVFRKK